MAFYSSGSSYVPGDTNNRNDVFVRDRTAGITTRVSVSSVGGEGNSDSILPWISPDGRWVAFESAAGNLVPGDTNGTWDVFVHDRETGQTVRASVDSNGVGGNWESHRATLSADGRRVAFDSLSTNLVPGDTNGWRDVFVRTCPLDPPVAYCVAKPNSLGCESDLAGLGTPSATAGSGFTVRATNVRSKSAGLLVYSRTSPTMLPFLGGWLCVGPPVRRAVAAHSGGNTGAPDCSGVLDADFNTYAASGKDAGLVPGTDVWIQYWSRDQGFAPPDNVGLTQGLAFVLGP